MLLKFKSHQLDPTNFNIKFHQMTTNHQHAMKAIPAKVFQLTATALPTQVHQMQLN